MHGHLGPGDRRRMGRTRAAAVGAAALGLLVPLVLGTAAGATGPWQPTTLAGPPGVSPFAGVNGAISCPPVGTSCVAVDDGGAAVVSGPSFTPGTLAPVAGSTTAVAAAGVSCTSTTACVAAGFVDPGPGSYDSPAVETLIGSTWTAQVLADPSGRSAGLRAVSCPAAGSCVAVGSDDGVPMVAALSGTTWQVTDLALPAGAHGVLRAISCPSGTWCVAVGSEGPTGVAGADLVETLSDGAWTPTLGLGPGTTSAVLSGISCPAAGVCVAVGSDSAGAQVEVLANGTWAAAAGPTLPGTTVSLTAVSCPAPGQCQAVGHDGSTPSVPVVAELAHGAWRAAALGAPAGIEAPVDLTLTGVSCRGPDNCDAVGHGVASSARVGISARDAGGMWSDAVVTGAPLATGQGVSCPSATGCVVVGWYADDQAVIHPLVESETGAGTWTPTDLTAGDGSLTSVACPRAGWCRAVGGGLVAGLDHGAWTVSSAPVPTGDVSVDLDAVACPTDTACVAVGQAFSTSGGQALAETLSSGTWTPSLLGSLVDLDALSCPSPSTCVAGGDGVVMTLDHGVWTPDSAGPNAVTGVSCQSASSCTAVGHSPTGQGEVATLSGSTWTWTDLANAGSLDQLSGLSCPTARQCVAVGQYLRGSGTTTRALVESLTDGTWTATVGIDPPGALDVQLAGVSCPVAGTCTAGGTVIGAPVGGLTSAQPLVERS